MINDQIKSTHTLFFHNANKLEQGRPFGGNAFLIRKDIFTTINVLFKNDHIYVIKTEEKGQTFFIIGVYLPSSKNNETSLEEYINQISVVQGMIDSCEDEGEIIILGDLQSFPLKIYESYPRFSNKFNLFSRYLSQFLESNEFQLVDVINASGPVYTYHHHTLPIFSYIEHIALQKNTSLEYNDCEVHSQTSLNWSDHLPISIKITYTENQKILHKNDIINIVNDNFIPSYAWKDYQFLQIYNEQLNAKFSNHEFFKIADEENLIETFNIITSSATYAFNMRYRNNNNHMDTFIKRHHYITFLELLNCK